MIATKVFGISAGHRSLFTVGRCSILAFAFFLQVGAVCQTAGATDPSGPTYDLVARLQPDAVAELSVSLEAGGDLLLPAESGATTKLPLSVNAELAYVEQLVAWSSNPVDACRSVRRYSTAKATIKTKDSNAVRNLPADLQVVVAELAESGFAMSGPDVRLSREQYDLLDVMGNTLALDRLLPGKPLREGEGWDHDAAEIGALLGMDHVAVCEVRSVVTGEANRQVQIRLAGTVHGTIDGSTTEMELRAAYLYHLDRGRITKLNLAVKEQRKPGEASPGLDIVAKLSVTSSPRPAASAPAFPESTLKRARAMTTANLREMVVDAPARGYMFRHDMAWFVAAEQRELMSLRLLDEGEFLAHCNVATAPPRPAEKPKTLAEFEREVCEALGDKVGKVAAATEWTTSVGRQCFGVLVDGTVNEVEVQWRYYYISAPGMPQATVSVTVEQSQLERFADADRALVDSLELIALPAQAAALKPSKTAK